MFAVSYCLSRCLVGRYITRLSEILRSYLETGRVFIFNAFGTIYHSHIQASMYLISQLSSSGYVVIRLSVCLSLIDVAALVLVREEAMKPHVVIIYILLLSYMNIVPVEPRIPFLKYMSVTIANVSQEFILSQEVVYKEMQDNRP